MVKSRVIQVRFSDENVVVITARAKLMGMSLSGYIRMVVLCFFDSDVKVQNADNVLIDSEGKEYKEEEIKPVDVDGEEYDDTIDVSDLSRGRVVDTKWVNEFSEIDSGIELASIRKSGVNKSSTNMDVINTTIKRLEK